MIEKRKEKRIKEENRVRIEMPSSALKDDHKVINALTQDISLGGAKIILDCFFEVGTEFKMVIILSRSKQVIKLRATVRWVRSIEKGLYEMGVEFQHGIPTSVLALINHLYGKEQKLPTDFN